MIKGFNTIQEASQAGKIPRSPQWIGAGIRLGLITAHKVGNSRLISDEECRRVSRNLDKMKISREQMSGVVEKN